MHILHNEARIIHLAIPRRKARWMPAELHPKIATFLRALADHMRERQHRPHPLHHDGRERIVRQPAALPAGQDRGGGDRRGGPDAGQPAALQAYLDAWQDERRAETKARAKLERQAADARARIDRMARLLIDGRVPEDAFDAEMPKARADLAALEARLAAAPPPSHRSGRQWPILPRSCVA